MAKKNAKLTSEQYWNWRASVAELQTAKANYRASEFETRCLQLEAEIAQLKARIGLKIKLAEASAQIELHKEEYKRFKEKLEVEIGTSLSDKVIDDVTFEVKDLPNDKTSLGA